MQLFSSLQKGLLKFLLWFYSTIAGQIIRGIFWWTIIQIDALLVMILVLLMFFDTMNKFAYILPYFILLFILINILLTFALVVKINVKNYSLKKHKKPLESMIILNEVSLLMNKKKKKFK